MLAGLVLALCSLAADPLRVMPLGDSITKPGKSAERYLYPLKRMMESSGAAMEFVGSQSATQGGVTLRHEGHNGISAEGILRQVQDWARSASPDVVLLHAGHNDHRHGRSVENTVIAIAGIVEALRELNPEIAVVIAQIIAAADDKSNPTGVAHAGFISNLNGQLVALATRLSHEKSPVTTVRFEAFDGNRHTRDGVHPNRVGESIMAAAWFDALHEISNRRSRLGPKDSPEH